MPDINDLMDRADRQLEVAKFEKKRKAWEKARRHGMHLYVLTRWVLGWGGFMLAFTYSWRIFVDHQQQDWSEHPTRILIFRILIWPAMGYLIGLLLWQINEGKFHNTNQLSPSIAKK
jgi:hypothetical protein